MIRAWPAPVVRTVGPRTPRSRTLAGAAVILSLVLTFPTMGMGQDVSPEAEEAAAARYRDGLAAYREAEDASGPAQLRAYRTAAEAFQEAYELSREPNAIRNLGVVAESARCVPEATTLFRYYLTQLDLDEQREERPETLERIATLEAAAAPMDPPPLCGDIRAWLCAYTDGRPPAQELCAASAPSADDPGAAGPLEVAADEPGDDVAADDGEDDNTALVVGVVVGVVLAIGAGVGLGLLLADDGGSPSGPSQDRGAVVFTLSEW